MNLTKLQLKQKRIVNSINDSNLTLEKLVKDVDLVEKQLKKSDEKLSEKLDTIEKKKIEYNDISVKEVNKQKEFDLLDSEISKTSNIAKDDAKRIVDGATDEKNEITISINSLSEEVSSAEKKLSELNLDIKKAKADKQRLSNQKVIINSEIESLSTTKKELDTEIVLNNKLVKAGSDKIIKNTNNIKINNINLTTIEVKKELITKEINKENNRLNKTIKERKSEELRTEKIIIENKKLEKEKFVLAEQRKRMNECITEMRDTYKRAGIRELPEILL